MEQVYVVLGGTGGIGSAVAKRLPSQQLLIAARSGDKLAQLASELGCASATVDVTDPQAVDHLFQELTTQGTTLRGVTLCVGSILLKPAHLTTPHEFQETLALNLVSAFNVVRAATRAMMNSGGGSIVLLSSVAGRFGLMNHEAIAAAKGGVIGLTLAAAATYANKNIRVNCVAPGLVDTPLASRITSNEASLKASTAMHPLGRIGQPNDVATVIAWLLQDESSWITGQVIGVDGGLGSVRAR